MKQVLLLVIGFAVSSTTEIDFKKCSDSEAFVTKVEMSPCPTKPCTFHKGDTVNVKITFTARTSTPDLGAKVFGIVLGVPVPFPLPNPDACTNSGIACPLVAGQEYVYNSSFPVLDVYPEISLIVEWKLIGSNQDESCFTFPMSIQ